MWNGTQSLCKMVRSHYVTLGEMAHNHCVKCHAVTTWNGTQSLCKMVRSHYVQWPSSGYYVNTVTMWNSKPLLRGHSSYGVATISRLLKIILLLWSLPPPPTSTFQTHPCVWHDSFICDVGQFLPAIGVTNHYVTYETRSTQHTCEVLRSTLLL